MTVPTPIDQARRPDLTSLLGASATVGKALKKGDIVVYESTVYPGATEEDCVPVLEQVSGLAAGRDFTVGYSPERSIRVTRLIGSRRLQRWWLARMPALWTSLLRCMAPS